MVGMLHALFQPPSGTPCRHTPACGPCSGCTEVHSRCRLRFPCRPSRAPVDSEKATYAALRASCGSGSADACPRHAKLGISDAIRHAISPTASHTGIPSINGISDHTKQPRYLRRRHPCPTLHHQQARFREKVFKEESPHHGSRLLSKASATCPCLAVVFLRDSATFPRGNA